MNQSLPKAVSIGIEFTDMILYDDIHDSIIITIDAEYTDHVIQEYEKFGYKLVHSTAYKEGQFQVFVFIRK